LGSFIDDKVIVVLWQKHLWQYMMVNLISDIKQSCLRCGKKALITDAETGEIFCGGCGFVLSERIESPGPERRSFSDDRINRERTGDGT